MLEILPSPKELGIPNFEELRPEQEEIIKAFLESADKFLIVCAPTGTGKSLIAPYLQKLINKSTTYVVNTRILQGQVLKWFPYGKEIKGRANYSTLNSNLTCKDCTLKRDVLECWHCHPNEEDCPYKVAKAEAVASPFVITNYAYFLNENRWRGSFNRELVVLDECDELEDKLRDMGKVSISNEAVREIGFIPRDLEGLGRFADLCVGKSRNEELEEDERAVWYVLATKTQALFDDGLESYLVNWAELRFTPILVDKLAQRFIWRKLPGKVILMSGTIPSIKQFTADLGIEEYSSLNLNSPFSVDNRRIYYNPGSSIRLSQEWEEKNFPDAIKMLRVILANYKGVRGLIHTSSFPRAQRVLEMTKAPRLILAVRGETAEDLERLRRVDNGVLVSPNALRGLDLKDDLCRFIVWFKAPYLDLGDEVVTRRRGLPDGQSWYTNKCISNFVQGCGRGVRSMTDWCDTWIIDMGCRSLVAGSPDWIFEAFTPNG